MFVVELETHGFASRKQVVVHTHALRAGVDIAASGNFHRPVLGALHRAERTISVNVVSRLRTARTHSSLQGGGQYRQIQQLALREGVSAVTTGLHGEYRTAANACGRSNCRTVGAGGVNQRNTIGGQASRRRNAGDIHIGTSTIRADVGQRTVQHGIRTVLEMTRGHCRDRRIVFHRYRQRAGTNLNAVGRHGHAYAKTEQVLHTGANRWRGMIDRA